MNTNDLDDNYDDETFSCIICLEPPPKSATIRRYFPFCMHIVCKTCIAQMSKLECPYRCNKK